MPFAGSQPNCLQANEFWFYDGLGTGLALRGRHSPVPIPMPRPFSVLLVEDDDPLRNVLFELLRQRGFLVHAAARGDEAVELARRVEIDFSLLDLHLPGLNGMEVFRAISRTARPLPAILMSGEATAEEARRALELGVVEFLRKPLDLDVLRRTLDELVRRHLARPSSRLPVRLEDIQLLRFLQSRFRPPSTDT